MLNGNTSRTLPSPVKSKCDSRPKATARHASISNTATSNARAPAGKRCARRSTSPVAGALLWNFLRHKPKSGTERVNRADNQTKPRRLLMSKVIDRIFGYLLILGACGHTIGTFMWIQPMSGIFIWSLGSSLAAALLGTLNVVRAGRPDDKPLAI